eukprot:3543608-Pleurochrysis_carterae.AAC.1
MIPLIRILNRKTPYFWRSRTFEFLFKGLWQHRNVSALWDLAQFNEHHHTKMLRHISIDDMCYHDEVVWRGIHIMELVNVLMYGYH